MILNENEAKGEIHPMALRQLAAKELIAEKWQTYYDNFDGEKHMRCKVCDLSIWCIWREPKHGGPRSNYLYTPAEMKALTVGHIANHHPEVFAHAND